MVFSGRRRMELREDSRDLGYFYSMLPMIKKQKDEEDRKNLAKTELQFF